MQSTGFRVPGVTSVGLATSPPALSNSSNNTTGGGYFPNTSVVRETQQQQQQQQQQLHQQQYSPPQQSLRPPMNSMQTNQSIGANAGQQPRQQLPRSRMPKFDYNLKGLFSDEEIAGRNQQEDGTHGGDFGSSYAPQQANSNYRQYLGQQQQQPQQPQQQQSPISPSQQPPQSSRDYRVGSLDFTPYMPAFSNDNNPSATALSASTEDGGTGIDTMNWAFDGAGDFDGFAWDSALEPLDQFFFGEGSWNG